MNRSFALPILAFILAVALPAHAQEAAKVRAALQQTGTLEFNNLTLDDIAEKLQAQLKVKVAVHESLRPLLDARQQTLRALPPAGTELPPPAEGQTPQVEYAPGFSCKLRNLRLGTALSVFLEHYGLGYAILGDALVLASADKAESLSREQPIDVSFDGVPLAQAAEELGRRYGVDVLVEAKEAREAKIKLRLRDVTLDEGVRLVAEAADLQAAPVGGGWLITAAPRARAWEARHERRTTEARKRWVNIADPSGAGLGGDLSAPMGGFGNLGGQAAPLGGGFAGSGGFVGGGGLQPGAGSDLRAPRAFLQVAGPAPRAGGDDIQEKKEPEAAPPKPRIAEPKNRSAAEVLKKLTEPSKFVYENPGTLKEVLQAWEHQGLPPVVIRQAAFKMENPDAPDLYETMVKLPPGMKGLPAGKVLRLILDQVPTADATYLVHPGYILVTTIKEAEPRMQFVQASFVNRPLDEALQELSELSGLPVLLDPRVGDKGRASVTARFAGETNLAQAVHLLADMADLRAVVVDTMMYVTSRGNGAQFPSLPFGPGKHLRPEVGVVQ